MRQEFGSTRRTGGKGGINIETRLPGHLGLTRMSTNLTSPVSRPWRRYLRFSVRGLIVVVLVIGAGLGWIVYSARVQRDAVAAIKRSGGVVEYDWAWNNGKWTMRKGPWAPRRLTDLFGIDYFGHVTSVMFIKGNDAAVAHVWRLTRLQRLRFDTLTNGNAAAAHLSDLTELRELDFGRVRTTDAALAHLKRLNNLSKLRLHFTTASDNGLAHLKGLTRMSELDRVE